MDKKEKVPKENDAEVSPSTAIGFTSLVPALLTTATLLGFCLHLVGHVSHESYLDSIGVRTDLFAQSAEAKIISGYHAIISQGAGLLSAMTLKSEAIIFLCFTTAVILSRIPIKRNGRLENWLERRSGLLRNVILSALSSMLFVAFIGAVAAGVLFLGIVPIGIGLAAGKDRANDVREQVISNTSNRRSELWRAGKRESLGYIVSVNDSLIAIYDVDAKVIRTLSRDGIEIRAALILVDNSEAVKAASP